MISTIAFVVLSQLDAGSDTTLQVFFYSDKTVTETSCFQLAPDAGEIAVVEQERRGAGTYSMKTFSDGGEGCVEVTSRGNKVADVHGASVVASGSAVLGVSGAIPPPAVHRETGSVSAARIAIGGGGTCALLALTGPFLGTQHGTFDANVATVRGPKGVEQVTLIADDQTTCTFVVAGGRLVPTGDCAFPVGGGEVHTMARCAAAAMSASFTDIGRLHIEARRCSATVPPKRNTPLAGCHFAADLVVEIAP